MYYVYILVLSDNGYYIGSTPNLKQRIQDHNWGKCTSTKDKRPVTLDWCCIFKDKDKALKFEKYLKGGSGTAFRHKHLE